MKVVGGNTVVETQESAERTQVHLFPNRWCLNYFICKNITEKEEEENTSGVWKETLTTLCIYYIYCAVIIL